VLRLKSSLELTHSVETTLLTRPPPGWTRPEVEGFFTANRLLVEEAADNAICQVLPFQVLLFSNEVVYVLTEPFEHESDADLAGHSAALEFSAAFKAPSRWNYWVIPSVMVHRSKDSWDREKAVSYWIEFQVGNRWVSDGVRLSYTFVEANRLEHSTNFDLKQSLVHATTQPIGLTIKPVVPQGQYLRYAAVVGANVWHIGRAGYAARPSLELLHKCASASIQKALYQADDDLDKVLRRQFGQEASTRRYQPQLDDPMTAAARRRKHELENYDLYESIAEFANGRWRTIDTQKIADGRDSTRVPALASESDSGAAGKDLGRATLGELLAQYHSEARILNTRIWVNRHNPDDYPGELAEQVSNLESRILELVPEAKPAIESISEAVERAAEAANGPAYWSESVEPLFGDLRKQAGVTR
jgi:hypothetical protein